MNIRQKIATLQQQINLRQIADDGYFLSRQYQEDCRLLYHLKQSLKKDCQK